MAIFNTLWGKISKDIGVDLGTANTLVYVRERGIVINQPSVVAINKKTGQLVAIGDSAKKMIGKTPEHIVAVKPLRAGVISDFEVTEQMLRYFFEQLQEENSYIVPRPRAVIGIPSGVTEVEKRAVEDAARNAGAREVWLVVEPMAAAVGARLPIFEAAGSMIVDIGGGTTEIAVISLGGLVSSKSMRLAGDKLTEDIIQYVREEKNVLLGEGSAERAKIEVASALKTAPKKELSVRGRDLVTGLPKEITLETREVRLAIENSLATLIESVRNAVEQTPPELVSDVMTRGIVLTGGGSLLAGLDERISIETGVTVRVAEDPMTAVVRGTGIILENLDEYREILANVEYLATPRE